MYQETLHKHTLFDAVVFAFSVKIPSDVIGGLNQNSKVSLLVLIHLCNIGVYVLLKSV